MTHPTPTPIPARPDFPVTWEQPDDALMCWTLDRMHFPDPMSPLEDAFMRIMAEHGFNSAAAGYALPVRFQARRINTYHYEAIVPLRLPPEELEALGRQSEEMLGAAMARLEELWEIEWLPEVQRYLAWWQGFDRRGAGREALAAHLDETVTAMHRLAEIHFLVGIPMLASMSFFDELYRDLFGQETAFDAYKLLQGFGNKTVESGRELWQLSRRAAAAPAVRRVLEERAAAEVIPALEQTPAGQAFLADLQAYLREYGQRGDKFEMSSPSWIEDPTPVLKNLKDYVSQSDRDPDAEQAALAAEREQLVAATRQRLRGYPGPVREKLEFFLKAAQAGVVLSEDHGFWIDYRSFHQIRLVLMECGRRLAGTGALAQASDVFYLTLPELRDVLRPTSPADQRGRVAERRAEMERFRAIAPPPAIGTDYGPPPDNPVTRILTKFFGGPPQPQDDPSTLRGNAGSPGKARGTARVIRSLAESGKLRRGDVLVAETTAPPWTPLFATAAAVVTDTGGVLSHCAIVAREYRIPAVVGIGVATAVIQDGQEIEVDGDAGVVRVLGAGC